ncbi:hypothetical protein BJ085DRAFT_1275, partial [Dimargaris cristalligena]
CSEIRVRREIRQLSPQERRDFFQAIRVLNQGAPPTEWDQLAVLHVSLNHTIHGNSFFLPFHRRYVYEMENRIREMIPGFAIPYWDWSIDAYDAASSEVFRGTNDWLGSQGQCLSDGAFAGFDVFYSQEGIRPHCLSRQFNMGSQIGYLYPPAALHNTMLRTVTYDQFRSSLEIGPHATVHRNLGGDMNTLSAPNDPIFWLHHSFIDKLWSEWQTLPGRFYLYDG